MLDAMKLLPILFVSAAVAGAAALAPAETKSAPAPYQVPLRSEAELMIAAREACTRALEANRPVLLEFTAEWCTDCRAVERMKARSEPLRAALAQVEPLPINVGRFDRHRSILQSFGVRAIAHWTVVAPSQCDAPLSSWRRIGSRTLEPASGTAVRSEELASWLLQQAERARPAAP